MNPARLFLLGPSLTDRRAADVVVAHAEPAASRPAHLPWVAEALLGATVALRGRKAPSSGVRGSSAGIPRLRVRGV